MTCADTEDMADFYRQLQSVIDTVHNTDMLIIMGDFNAKVGEYPEEGIMGRHRLGDRNEAGENLIEFCATNSLWVGNTWFELPKRRKYTWTSPNGEHRNQIDYIICRQQWRTSIRSVNTRPGADCGSDHELLLATLRMKFKKTSAATVARRLDLKLISEEYAIEVKKLF